MSLAAVDLCCCRIVPLQKELLMRSFFRQVCADTIVGSQMVRGISGGQRKRVTTGEMVVGPMKTLFLVSPSQQCSSKFTCIPALIQPQ